jgi:FMN phosphatase YigB (HAD superfamily)
VNFSSGSQGSPTTANLREILSQNRLVIEAVTFDFWNTIARVPAGAMTEARRRAVAAACASNEVEVETELLLTSLDQVGLDWERSWAAGRHLHPREAAESLVRALGVDGAAREIVAEAFLCAGREVKLELAPDIGSSLEALCEREIRLGIVCDVGFSGGELLRELLDREGLLAHFSGWAFSDEVGHYKPAPQIFEAALESLGAEPASALHVGDLRRTDVAGAAAHGMRTVRYRGMNDEGVADRGPEADHVLDAHAELVALVDSLSDRPASHG